MQIYREEATDERWPRCVYQNGDRGRIRAEGRGAVGGVVATTRPRQQPLFECTLRFSAADQGNDDSLLRICGVLSCFEGGSWDVK